MLTFKQFLADAVSPETVDLKLDYHKQLNPDFWTNKKLRSKVRKALLKIAKEFKEHLEMPAVRIVDVILTGSMANYNWTAHSDVDLHLIVDIKQEESSGECQAIDIKKVFQAKQTLWKDHHDIKIYNHPVEIYVQFANEHVVAAGIFSLTLNTWIEKPKYDVRAASFNNYAVKVKASRIMNAIDKAMEENASRDTLEKIKERIKEMRKGGLATGGEFSIENLAFKALRNAGYIDKIVKYLHDKQDKQLSVT